MSLDVYLYMLLAPVERSGIYIREDGAVKEISREEWDSRFPGIKPAAIGESRSDEVYWANITHNLGRMAREAGIYKHLWRPSEIDIEIAAQLIKPLRKGLELLKSDPDRFRQFNPENGWGDYDGFVMFVQNYLNACENYPQASVYASR